VGILLYIQNMNVEDDPLFLEFCQNRNIAKSTINLYKIALTKYTDFTKMTLEELIHQAELEEDLAVRMRKRKIKEYLTRFQQSLETKNLSESYIKVQLTLIKAFYYENDIILPKLHRKSRKDKKVETFDDLPTMQDVKTALEYANTTYKAIILLNVSSGMSRAELCSLTFKNFYDAIPLSKYPETIPVLVDQIEQLNNLIPLWKITRVKTGNKFFTFSSPEATDAILEYLKELHRNYPDYKPNPEDIFLRNRNIPITPLSLGSMYQRINKKAGFRKVNGHLLIRPHSLRKLFATTLEKNRMPHLMTRWLMGHKLDPTTGAYFKADPETVKEDYIQILDQLTTSKVQIKLINQYQEVKQEIEELRTELFEKKFIELKDKINEYPKDMGN
jgi:integrase